jgi:hypothetical protein
MSYRWYLTVVAVKEFAALANLQLDDGGPLWSAAEKSLSQICDSAKMVSDDGRTQIWRTGRMAVAGDRGGGRGNRRWELYVRTTPRPEGPLPQLVRVRAK